MKKFICAVLAVVLLAFAPLGAACQPTDPTTTTFRIMEKLPFATPSGYEKLTYDYTRTQPDSGTVVENGTVVMEAYYGSEQTELRITEKIYDTASGLLLFESASSVTMATVGLYPRLSSKTVKVYNPKNLENFADSSYTVSADYSAKTSSGSIAGKAQNAITIPDIGVNCFDNEQLFYLVRSATNLETLENTGTFDLANMADSYFSEKFYKHEMIYSVLETATVSTEKLQNAASLGLGEAVPCYKISLKINSNKSGPGTVLYISDQAFTSGETVLSDRVIMKMVREQYDVNTFVMTYVHEYVLSSYSASL